MKRPSKKDIKAAIDALKANGPDKTGQPPGHESKGGPLSEKKSSKRIRKQGI